MTPDAHSRPVVPLLEARGLVFLRDDVPVFGPLDLQIEAGEAVLVQGANGAGKTTLLRVIAGLLRPAEGGLWIDGAPATRDQVARDCLLLGHLLGHKGELGCAENLRFATGLFGQRPGSDIERVLADVGLAGYEDVQARSLSAGQRKRLALARLRLLPARLWLLDEPYANLDLDGIALVNRLVEAHLADGGGAFITTHGAYAAPAARHRVVRIGGRA